MELGVSTIESLEDLKAIEPEWVGLFHRAKSTLPFLLPEWLTSWWEFYGQDRMLLRDSLRVRTVRRDGGELVGLIPFMQTERPSFGPARARGLSFLGTDQYVTEQPSPLLDPSCEGPVALALVRQLDRDPSWDWIQWYGLKRETAFAGTLSREMELTWTSAQPANLLRLRPTWEEFRAGLKRNIKESLRHGYNSLKRDGLSARLVVTQAAHEVAPALEVFLALHAKRAALRGTVVHPDHFADATPRRFLLAACARLADRGIVRVFTLEVDGVPAACRIGFVLPDCLYLYYSGFDPAFRKYGVMTTTVAEIIKYAILLGLPAVHLSMGDDVSKSRWGPERSTYSDAVAVRPRLSSRAALRMFLWARGVEPHAVLHRLLPFRRQGRG